MLNTSIIHEQELFDAGDQLVAYLAQQGAGPAPSCRNSRTACSPPERCESPSSFCAHLTAGPDGHAPAPVTRQRPRGD